MLPAGFAPGRAGVGEAGPPRWLGSSARSALVPGIGVAPRVPGPDFGAAEPPGPVPRGFAAGGCPAGVRPPDVDAVPVPVGAVLPGGTDPGPVPGRLPALAAVIPVPGRLPVGEVGPVPGRPPWFTAVMPVPGRFGVLFMPVPGLVPGGAVCPGRVPVPGPPGCEPGSVGPGRGPGAGVPVEGRGLRPGVGRGDGGGVGGLAGPVTGPPPGVGPVPGTGTGTGPGPVPGDGAGAGPGPPGAGEVTGPGPDCRSGSRPPVTGAEPEADDPTAPSPV